MEKNGWRGAGSRRPRSGKSSINCTLHLASIFLGHASVFPAVKRGNQLDQIIDQKQKILPVGSYAILNPLLVFPQYRRSSYRKAPFPIPVGRPVPPPPGTPSSAALPGCLGGEEGHFGRAGSGSEKLGRAPRAAARDRAKAPRDPRHRLGAAPAALSPVSPSPGDALTPGDCRSPRRLPGGFWGGRRQGTPAGWPLPAPPGGAVRSGGARAPAAAGAARPGPAPRSPAPTSARSRQQQPRPDW